MNSPIVRLGVVPALALLPLTVLRTWLECNHPDSAVTPYVSVLALSGVWIALTAVLLLKGGASFGTLVKTVLAFALLVRGPLAAVYALAWANKWTTPAGAPVRYVKQIVDQMHMPLNAPALQVFIGTWLFPTAIHVVAGVVLWFLLWAIAFRKRSAIKAS